MAVVLGSARHDEFGRYTNGKAGDQDGTEVSTQPFYQHSKGWIVIRAKDYVKANKIADCMQWACANDHIGYDQNERDTLYAEVRLSDFDVRALYKNVETDCSALVRVCVNYAGIKAPDFYTGNAAEILKKTGEFDVLEFTSEQDLKRGDILCTKVKGHIVVCLSSGTKEAYKYPCWTQVNGIWYYRLAAGVNAHGFNDINGHRYYFNEKGEMLKDWQQIDGKWYYFQPSGALEGAMYRSDENGVQAIWNL